MCLQWKHCAHCLSNTACNTRARIMPDTHYDFLHDPTHNDSYQQTCTSFWHVPTVTAAISLLELVESCCKLGGCGCWYNYIVARYITCRIILCTFCLIPAPLQRYCFHTLLSGGACMSSSGWAGWPGRWQDWIKWKQLLHYTSPAVVIFKNLSSNSTHFFVRRIR